MPSTRPAPVTALQPWISQCRVEKRSECSCRSSAISLAEHAPPWAHLIEQPAQTGRLPVLDHLLELARIALADRHQRHEVAFVAVEAVVLLRARLGLDLRVHGERGEGRRHFEGALLKQKCRTNTESTRAHGTSVRVRSGLG